MSTTSDSSDRPLVDFDQEVRFAVVMYGGSSLAIYINGVAQELLRLVRATAPGDVDADGNRRAHLADGDLRASERVYRRLGRILGRQGVHDADGRGESPRIRTRFVVDILTGTSAGGINAVYLAKALANDQDMDELKNLWVTEGDISVLLNDEESYKELGFTLDDEGYPGEPWSVLNSRRMHLRLLEALRGMEAKRLKEQGAAVCASGDSPLVDELDLYVTATDMQGRVVQLRLADKLASEYRHRNVFRFRYRGKRAGDTDLNQLAPENNAFLAFAARATSAHQAAFSPVKLEDGLHVAARHALEGERREDDPALRAFYQEYLLERGEGEGAPAGPDKLAADFRRVWFVDGGTLDNKPFSFVIEQLPLRHADTFVDRKLLYVEPSPEHAERAEALKERPRIKENVLAALSSLPRYETIVEDLTRLLERNRLVERLGSIMRGIESDFRLGMRPKEARTRNQLRKIARDEGELREWLLSKGASWGGYQRLRVAEVTDDLTLLVARAAGFSEESDEYVAIRYLVRDWRAANYHPHMEGGRRSELEFLLDFDLAWAMRRVRFCLGKLNDLACLDARASEIAGAARGESGPQDWPRDEAGKEEFRAALLRMRRQLNEAFLVLRDGRRRLWSRDYETNPFRRAIASLELTSADLLRLLRQPTDQARRDEAQRVLGQELVTPGRPARLQTRSDAVDMLTRQVRAALAGLIKEAGGKCSDAMRPPDAETKKDGDATKDGANEGGATAADSAREATAADSRRELEAKDSAREEKKKELPRWELFLRETLFYYYKYFNDFDQISYPLLYSTGVGEEADVIDVFRVSPEDATALIDESHPVDDRGRKVTDGAAGRRVVKVAGNTLGHFGAFFREEFRVNDIMWGRLDGAERIIAALLPSDEGLRERMTEQAHRAILVEEMLFADKAAAADRALQLAIWDALDAWDTPRREQLLRNALQLLPRDSTTFRDYLDKLAQGAEPRDLFAEEFVRTYDEARRFEEDAMINSAKRAQRVLGGMALHYFPEKDGGSKMRRFAMWLGKRLRIFVEAAIEPDGDARRAQRWKLTAAYLASLLILTLLCLPAVLLMVMTDWPWSALGFLALLLTLPFALLPLVATAGYNLAWLKLRGKLAALLPRASKT